MEICPAIPNVVVPMWYIQSLNSVGVFTPFVSWACPTCTRTFDSYRGYSLHYNAKHEGHALVAWYGEEDFKELCRSMSVEKIKNKLKVSQPAVENAVESVSVEYPVECPNCNAGFADYYSYTKHYQTKHDGHPLIALHGEDRLREMYSTMSEHAVANELGVSRTAVKSALRSLGINRRGQSEAEKLKNKKKTPAERREQTRKARETHFQKFGDGGYISKWMSKNEERHREIAQEAAPLGTQHRDENGMKGVTGQEHPRWRGGKSIYGAVKKQLHGPSWDTLRERTRERAGHECEMCGKPSAEIEHRSLDVHHIVPVMCGGTNEAWNRMALCPSCHRKTEIYTRELLDPVLTDK
jgi:predicted transcriptional regulator/uncharacterized C2H2 Zn-finger protein